jgi:mono/diheme cytochrome c family protein
MQIKMTNVNRHTKAWSVLGITILFSVFVSCSASAQDKGKKWVAPETAKKLKPAVPADDENITAGKALYAKHCKSCHGGTGKGDGPKAANLEKECGDFTSADVKALSEGELYWMTTEGNDPMPTFKKKTTDEERWQIIRYVKTLGKK